MSNPALVREKLQDKQILSPWPVRHTPNPLVCRSGGGEGEVAEASLYSIQVSNQGRGLAVEIATGDGWWFDFAATIPETRVTPVVVPEPYYINVGNKSLSNDGQLAVAKIASTTKVKGGYTYTYRPGVVLNGALVWEGNFDGETFTS